MLNKAKFILTQLFLLLLFVQLHGQDTIYQNKIAEHQIYTIENGYKLVFLLKSTDSRLDTVAIDEFGAYYNTRIKEIRIENDRFICTYMQPDMIGYFIYERQDGKWLPLMGGPLRFFGKSIERFDAIIHNDDAIELIIGDEHVRYQIDYSNKLLKLEDK